MPLFPWYDGSRKYLHVDVPQLEEYASRVQGHIEGRVRERVGWLLSGSRVPFGVITEERWDGNMQTVWLISLWIDVCFACIYSSSLGNMTFAITSASKFISNAVSYCVT